MHDEQTSERFLGTVLRSDKKKGEKKEKWRTTCKIFSTTSQW